MPFDQSSSQFGGSSFPSSGVSDLRDIPSDIGTSSSGATAASIADLERRQAEAAAQLAALQMQMQKQSELTNATVAELERRRSLDASAAGQSAFELRNKQAMVSAQLGRTAIADAQAAFSQDPADLLVLRAREAQSAVQALETEPNAPVDVSRLLIATVYEAAFIMNMLGDDARQQLQPVVSRIVSRSNQLFGAIENKGVTDEIRTIAPPLQGDLMTLVNIAQSLQVRSELPPDVQENIPGAQAAIREALSAVERYRSNLTGATGSGATGSEVIQKLNSELLNNSAVMLNSAKDIIDCSSEMQTNFQTADHAIMRKWPDAVSSAVDTLLTNVPEWLISLGAVIKGQGQYEELQALTRKISSCSAHLVALVRTQSVGKPAGLEGNSNDIERTTVVLQTAARRVIALTAEIGRYHLSTLALEEYSKLGSHEVNKMLLSSQAEALRLEKALESERERVARLRKMQYAG